MSKSYKHDSCLCGKTKKKSSANCNDCRLAKIAAQSAIVQTEKICNQCKVLLLAEKFYKKSNGRLRPICIECFAHNEHLNYLANPEKHNERAQNWQKNHPDRVKIISKKSRDKNKDKRAEQFANWYYSDHENNLARQRENRKNNGYYDFKSKVHVANRRARKKQATPPWVLQDKVHMKLITDFYANCPKGYEVDHIVPLRGKTVWGLHVIWNLQYLTKEANMSKGNRMVA